MNVINRQDAINAIIAHDGTMDKSVAKRILIQLPSTEPLTEEDYTELRDRFGGFVEFVVRDMISGKGERWETNK